jgi:hypothetical protein
MIEKKENLMNFQEITVPCQKRFAAHVFRPLVISKINHIHLNKELSLVNSYLFCTKMNIPQLTADLEAVVPKWKSTSGIIQSIEVYIFSIFLFSLFHFISKDLVPPLI